MTQNRTVPLLVTLLLVCAALVVWLFTPIGGGAPGVSPVGSGTPTAEGAGAAAALSSEGGTGARAAVPEAGGRQAVAAGTAAPAGRFSVSGRVVGTDGAAVPGVVLTFAPSTGGDLALVLEPEADAPGVTRATTGTDGRFSLLLPAATEHRFAVSEQPYYLRESGRALRVAMLTGDRDLGDLVVGRAASLVGRVLEELSGQPCGGVRVSLGGGLALMMRESAPTTDADGRFAFANLRPGVYTLTTASPAYLPAQVKLELGEGEARADFAVKLVAGGSIAGVVLDDTGKPVAGLKVGAERARAMGAGIQVRTTSSAEATETDAAGRFQLRGLDPGVVNVSAWGKGHARASLDGVAVGTGDLVLRAPRLGRIRGVVVDGDGAPVVGSAVVANNEDAGIAGMRLPGISEVKTDAKGEFVLEEVAPGTNTVVVTGEHRRLESGPLTVVAGDTLAGVRLVAQRGATLVVSVVDAAGQPVADAKVELTGPEEDAGAAGWQTARRVTRRIRAGGAGNVQIDDGAPRGGGTTDAQGIARISGLEAGRVVAKVRHATFFPAQSAEVSVPERGEVETKVSVAPGGFVSVTALDSGRAPLADASFKLVGPQEAGPDAKTETGHCDAAGVANVGPLAPGTYRACLVLPAPPMQLGDAGAMVAIGAEGRDLSESSATVTLVAEKTTAVTLTRPVLATLRGVLRDAQGPVAGGKVQVSQAGEPDMGMFTTGPRATTDAEGRFEIADLSAGSYDIRFGHRDALMMCEERLTVASGQSLVERELFMRTGTVRVVVRDDDGVPVPRAQVTLDRGSPREQTTGAPRRTRAVMIMTRTNDSDQGMSTTSISSGPTSVSTDIEGVAELVRVPQGEYTLRVEHAKYATTRKSDVKVMEGDRVDLGTLTMAAGGTLTGRVLSADGQPVDFATVEVTPVQGGEPRTEMAMGGAIRVTGLAAGTYRARARILNAEDWGSPVEFELGKGERKTLELRAR